MAARDEALRAIAHVTEMLGRDLAPLDRKLALATLDYARESVEAIQEVKRKRRKKGEA